MARSSQKEQSSQLSPTNSPASQPSNNPAVSLKGPPADVDRPGPSEEIVIGKVDSKPQPEPDPVPVVTTDKDGTITIK